MALIELIELASVPVLKVLLLTGVGLFLALDRVDVLGDIARDHLNNGVFYVFNPSFVGIKLAQTVTFKSFLTLWFMPVNVLFTTVLGSALGWLLVKITKPPKQLKGLIIGSCSAGNLGNLMIIIIPAMCKEEGSPFGDADTCRKYGMAYASLSMALGALFLWSYVYNIVRASSTEMVERPDFDQIITAVNNEASSGEIETSTNYTEPLLSSSDCSPKHHLSITSSNKAQFDSGEIISYGNMHTSFSSQVISCENTSFSNQTQPKSMILLSDRIKQWLKAFSESINLKELFAPSTIGAIAGFVIGMVGPIRRLLIGNTAPLHIIDDSTSLLGDAAIPTTTLILGANLLQGLRRSDIQLRIVMGIVVVRFIFLPLLGILIIRGAIHFGILKFDPLFQFVLLLQYAVPPAMNIGTITQLFGAGQSECSVIMLWTHVLAVISLTLWCTYFLWLVA